MEKRIYPVFFDTTSGRLVDIFNPNPESIVIEDIAHHLARINRYNGSTLWPYSVAQHCWLLAKYALNSGLGHKAAMFLLLHDAAEAYLQDIIRDLKPFFNRYEDVEYTMQQAIFKSLGMSFDPRGRWEQMLMKFDKQIVLDEMKVLKPNSFHLWFSDSDPLLGVSIVEWAWDYSEYRYFNTFKRLEHFIKMQKEN